jgi:hypothetical protein
MSGASILFSQDAMGASGVLDGSGQGPVRIFVTAFGNLTSCHVQAGPDAAHLVTVDSSTFNSMTVGVTRQLWLDRPINLIVLLPVGCAIDARVTRSLRP